MVEKRQSDPLKDKAHLRHIRRFVWAPGHRMAAIAPPELSTLCREELSGLGITQTEITEAGVEFQGELGACYSSNLWLRTASRILCRFPAFRAGAVEELFTKVNGFRWELWLNPSIPLHLETFVTHSRIEHEGTVENAVFSGIERRFRSLGFSPPAKWSAVAKLEPGHDSITQKQRILIHLRENRCEISLDSTGNHLHQRGYRLLHMGAPLRETLAAALLLKTGWRADSPFVDGMCGAGTLPIEAALLARRLPPGGKRRFLFEKWPSLRVEQWAYLRRKALEQALAESPSRIVAVDSSARAIETARENALRAEVEEDIEWICADFLQFEPGEHRLGPGLIILDPPYGKRLDGGGKVLYEQLGAHLRRSFRGWHAVVLAPDRPSAIALRLPSMRFWNITHGGLPIIVALARI
jgi:23S rRNA G2445 N2-methylase RlmL